MNLPCPYKVLHTPGVHCLECGESIPAADASQDDESTIKIQISSVKNATPLPTYCVTVENKKATWTEFFPTMDFVSAFVRGVKAGASLQGQFDVREDWAGVEEVDKSHFGRGGL
jgi:hypothetical protein